MSRKGFFPVRFHGRFVVPVSLFLCCCMFPLVIPFASVFADLEYSIPPSSLASRKMVEGTIFLSRSNFAMAYESFSSAMIIIENDNPLSVYGLVRADLGCGWASLRSGDMKKCELHFKSALENVNKSPLRKSLLKVEVLRACAALYDRTSDKEHAVYFYEEAIKALYKETPAHWITLADTLESYSDFIRRLPGEEGWFGLHCSYSSDSRNPEQLEKRALLLRKRAEKEPYEGK